MAAIPEYRRSGIKDDIEVRCGIGGAAGSAGGEGGRFFRSPEQGLPGLLGPDVGQGLSPIAVLAIGMQTIRAS